MDFSFDVLRQTRRNIVGLMDRHLDQAHVIPTGFNNNLWWNAAHMVATQQLLCYGLAGLPFLVENDWIEAYRKGTAPTTSPAHTWEDLKTNLLITPDQMEADWKAGKFNAFKPYPTSFGIELTTWEGAAQFNNVHEGLHLGYCMALSKHL